MISSGHGNCPRLAAAASRFRSPLRRARTIAAVCSAQLALLVAVLAGCDPAVDVHGADAGPTEDAARADGSVDAPAATPSPVCPCFDGSGTYCEVDVAARATAAGCVALDASLGGDRLLTCDGGTWTAGDRCADGCAGGELEASAACELPSCDCFVRASWCGASAARHALTLDAPCRIPLLPEHDQDLLGCDASGHWTVLEACPLGCAEAPTGTPDACVSDRTPEDPGWDACPRRPLLAWGLHPEASDRLRCAGVTADRVTQTIGRAAASAGYHAEDGTVDGEPYCAAVDLRARDLSESEIRALLDRLGHNGFAAWYRKPGYDGWPSSQAAHIHAVFAGVPMKSQLRGQVQDFLLGLDGLVSHATYRFWRAPAAVRDIVRLLFSRHYTP